MMTDILSRIRAYKLEEVAASRAARPWEAIRRDAADASPPRPFAARLARAAEDGLALIAEIKRASPSRGLIRADFDPPALARAYADGGAACLSVLTDGPSFRGAPAHLTAARGAADLPVLRKDFLFEPWQVAEARAMGADAILIIMAAVTDDEAAALAEAAGQWGMDALIEVHDGAELDRASRLSPAMIGMNNRDLRTFETSLDVTRDLAPRLPAGALGISESGLATHDDLAAMVRAGIRAFLIGESLMRAGDVAAATRALLTGAEAPA